MQSTGSVNIRTLRGNIQLYMRRTIYLFRVDVNRQTGFCDRNYEIHLHVYCAMCTLTWYTSFEEFLVEPWVVAHVSFDMVSRPIESWTHDSMWLINHKALLWYTDEVLILPESGMRRCLIVVPYVCVWCDEHNVLEIHLPLVKTPVFIVHMLLHDDDGSRDFAAWWFSLLYWIDASVLQWSKKDFLVNLMLVTDP